MLDLILTAISYCLVVLSSSVIMVICACVGSRMDKGTCNRVRSAYVIIFMAAFGAVASLVIKKPTIIETLSLTGLAVLFLFDRRDYYGIDNRDGMQDMSVAKKTPKVQ